MIAQAGLRRLDQERDLNRILVRDLAHFPDLLAEMAQEEIEPIYRVVTAWLAEQAGPQAPERDWPALAAVLVNATSHYWLLGDIFGQDPAGITEDRYVAALAGLAASLLQDDYHGEEQQHLSTGGHGPAAATGSEPEPGRAVGIAGLVALTFMVVTGTWGLGLGAFADAMGSARHTCFVGSAGAPISGPESLS